MDLAKGKSCNILFLFDFTGNAVLCNLSVLGLYGNTSQYHRIFHAGTLTEPRSTKSSLCGLFDHIWDHSLWQYSHRGITITYSPTLVSLCIFSWANLSFIDTCYSSSMVPRLIADSLYEGRATSYEGCMAQL